MAQETTTVPTKNTGDELNATEVNDINDTLNSNATDSETRLSSLESSLGETISVATIEDQKPQGTEGGTFTSGARRTRDLNTITSDENSIVTLNANQFTLQAGTYVIEASAPAFKVNKHTAFIRNVTDSVDVAISQAQRDDGTSSSTGQTFAVGGIVITSPKVFEIQHECQTTFASSGFGQSTNFSVGVFTQVKITKFG